MLPRHIALLLLLAALSSALAGCEREPRYGPFDQWLVVGLEGNPTNLDPRFSTDAYSSRLVGVIYSSLVRLDESGAPVGDLAENWETPDEVTYRFHLKGGVTFHNGSELTCADIKYTYDLLRAPDSTSPYRSDFRLVENVVCNDERNIEIRLSHPFAPFMIALTVGILPRGVDPATLSDHPVGSGPFRFVEWVREERIVLRRFAGYHGKKARLDGVTFRVLPNGVTRVLELAHGGVDLLQNSIPPEALDQLAQKKGIEMERRPGINYNYLGFNLDHPVLKNRLVREAIARAIDRQDIIKYLWRGSARPAGNLLSPSHWAYNPEVVAYPYTPDIAKKLLDDAGYPDPDGPGPDVRFGLTYKTSTNRLRRRIAEVIKTQLAQVGIGIKVRSYEWGTFYRDIKSGNFELYSLAWVGVVEPDHYRAIFHSSNIPPNGTQMNRNRYRNKEIDRLTEAGRSTANVEKRKRIYAEVQRIAAYELPYVSLYYTDDVVARRRYVKGWRIRPGGDFMCLPEVRIER